MKTQKIISICILFGILFHVIDLIEGDNTPGVIRVGLIVIIVLLVQIADLIDAKEANQ